MRQFIFLFFLLFSISLNAQFFVKDTLLHKYPIVAQYEIASSNTPLYILEEEKCPANFYEKMLPCLFLYYLEMNHNLIPIPENEKLVYVSSNGHDVFTRTSYNDVDTLKNYSINFEDHSLIVEKKLPIGNEVSVYTITSKVGVFFLLMDYYEGGGNWGKVLNYAFDEMYHYMPFQAGYASMSFSNNDSILFIACQQPNLGDIKIIAYHLDTGVTYEKEISHDSSWSLFSCVVSDQDLFVTYTNLATSKNILLNLDVALNAKNEYTVPYLPTKIKRLNTSGKIVFHGNTYSFYTVDLRTGTGEEFDINKLGKYSNINQLRAIMDFDILGDESVVMLVCNVNSRPGIKFTYPKLIVFDMSSNKVDEIEIKSFDEASFPSVGLRTDIFKFIHVYFDKKSFIFDKK